MVRFLVAAAAHSFTAFFSIPYPCPPLRPFLDFCPERGSLGNNRKSNSRFFWIHRPPGGRSSVKTSLPLIAIIIAPHRESRALCGCPNGTNCHVFGSTFIPIIDRRSVVQVPKRAVLTLFFGVLFLSTTRPPSLLRIFDKDTCSTCSMCPTVFQSNTLSKLSVCLKCWTHRARHMTLKCRMCSTNQTR